MRVGSIFGGFLIRGPPPGHDVAGGFANLWADRP